MTGLAELLADCDAHNIRLFPAGDGGLTIDAPQSALTTDLMGRLKARKAELLAILRHKDEPPSNRTTDATAAWNDALERLKGDPDFPPDVIAELRAADVRWATDETPTEPADETALGTLRPDGWPTDSIDPDELDSCPKCGTLELWQTLAGNWRCLRCDPPTTAHRLAERAERIRHRTNRTGGTGRKGQCRV